MKNSKNILKSKTFWFNVLGIAAEISNIISMPPGISLIVSNIINIALRIITDKPVTILPKEN